MDAAQEDIAYFKNKAIVAITEGNWDRAKLAIRKLELMGECLIVYKLSKHDWPITIQDIPWDHES